jgi:hypothetical protein
LSAISRVTNAAHTFCAAIRARLAVVRAEIEVNAPASSKNFKAPAKYN